MTAGAILSTVQFKPCSKCKLAKTLDDFHLRSIRGILKPMARCKECIRASDRDRAQANPEKVKEQNAKQYAKNAERGRAYSAKYRADHPEQIKASIAAWNAVNSDYRKAYKESYNIKNKDKVAAALLVYRAANVDKIKEAAKVRYAKNKDSIKASRKQHYARTAERQRQVSALYRVNNPEAVSAAAKRYHVTNKDKWRAYANNRRSLKLNAGGRLSPGIAKKLFALQKGRCACCGKPLKDGYHLDHIMPLALGGANTDDNMQLLTQRCNNQKYSKHPVDFMQERGFLL